MDAADRERADALRCLLATGQVAPTLLRDALLGVSPHDRDAWLDVVFALDAIPDDGPALPRGCVPYLPCPVDALLRAIDIAAVGPSDTFVDLGSGAGRTAALVHLLTGASVIGVEIQPALVRASRELMARLHVARSSFVEGDATGEWERAAVTGALAQGTVFFFYCPFDRERLETVVDRIEDAARVRAVRLCFVDVPPPERSWLVPLSVTPGTVAVVRSNLAS